MRKSIIHSCSHSATHWVIGIRVVRQRIVRYHQGRLCPACQEARQAPLAELLRPQQLKDPAVIPLKTAYYCPSCQTIQEGARRGCVQCQGEVRSEGWFHLSVQERRAWMRRITSKPKPHALPVENVPYALTVLEGGKGGKS